MSQENQLVHAERQGPSYWKVTFNNPPFNLYEPEVESSLARILDQLLVDPDVKIVVFDSGVDNFFMAHLNLSRIREFGDGMPTWFDLVDRLRSAPFITVGSIRGRARGIGNEFLTALDIRFASRENAILGQLEIGLGIIPGCGGLERTLRLVGRSRALEIIASGGDYDADTAEAYGWINRALPDAELDDFVDRFAKRIASFDTEALVAIKTIINGETSPASAERLKETHTRFNQLFVRDSVQGKLQGLGNSTPEQRLDLELNMAERLGPR